MELNVNKCIIFLYSTKILAILHNNINNKPSYQTNINNKSIEHLFVFLCYTYKKIYLQHFSDNACSPTFILCYIYWLSKK